MDTLLDWINTGRIDKLREYIKSLRDVNSILVYDEDVNLNLLHIISANDGKYRIDALNCLLEESEKSIDKPKLDLNKRSGPGNDCFTALHLAACYGNLSTLKILLDHGADPEILDRNGLDAIDVATAYDQYRCVDLIRKKIKSNNDLNKSCDTVFYSFRNSSIDTNRSGPMKRDANVQTSGQNTLNSTFNSALDNRSLNESTDLDKTIQNNNRLISSTSKVLDEHRREFEKNKKLNRSFIKDFMKDNKSSSIVRNLRKTWEDDNCKDSSSDESIDPFADKEDKISIKSLGNNLELYTDNEFNVSFINETKEGTKDSLQESDFLVSLVNSSSHSTDGACLSSTLKNMSLKDDKSFNQPANQPVNESIYDELTNDQLYEELVKFKFRPGPITSGTRSVYIKKLIELQSKNKFDNKLNNERTLLNVSVGSTTKNSEKLLMFSRPLRQLMRGEFDFKLARELESEFIEIFEQDKLLNRTKSTPNKTLNKSTTRTSSKQFFNYLLIDPRITQNLSKRVLDNSKPSQSSQPDDLFTLSLFKLFILAIFYIGKGQGNRPYSHLYDAAKLEENQNKSNKNKKSNIKKLSKIKEIWSSGHGVVSLHCFHNIGSTESLTRECLMIDSIGLKFLTNIQIGQNRIKELKWTQYKKDVLGSYLLFKAFNILLVNGEREIKRADVN